jgi:hypothetical protein
LIWIRVKLVNNPFIKDKPLVLEVLDTSAEVEEALVFLFVALFVDPSLFIVPFLSRVFFLGFNARAPPLNAIFFLFRFVFSLLNFDSKRNLLEARFFVINCKSYFKPHFSGRFASSIRLHICF